MGFVEARSDYDRPNDEEDQRANACVDDVLKGGHSFDRGMGVSDRVVIEGEEAVEGSD